MKKITLLFSAIIFSVNGFGQAPSIQWQKCLGGDSIEGAWSIIQTSDGGYIVAGYSQSNNGDVTGNHGANDYWIVKLDNSGNLQWQKCLGGTDSDVAHYIQQTVDGGYIVTGSAWSNNGDVTGNHGANDYWVVKLNNSGTLQWQKCLGGTDEDIAWSVQQTFDGGYIVAGSTHSIDGDVTGNHGGNDYWLVKLDSSGNIQWQKCLGGTGPDFAVSIKQLVDGGYIVSGNTSSNDGDVTGFHGGGDYWVVKLDSNGNIQWQKCLGGTSYDFANCIQQTVEGGYIVAGSTISNNGDVTGNHGSGFLFDYWVVKLDSIGNIQWQKCLGGTDDDQAAYSIQQTTDGGYIVAGRTNSNDGDVTGNHGSGDYWVVKLDSVGNIEWQRCLGGIVLDWAYSIQQTSDGGYIVTGNTYSNDGDVSGNHGQNDFWVVKLSSSTGTKEEMSNTSLNLSPNPATTSFTIYPEYSGLRIREIEIYNTLGEKVYSQQQTTNDKQQTVNVSQLLPGVYFVAVTDGKGNKITRKFIKM